MHEVNFTLSLRGITNHRMNVSRIRKSKGWSQADLAEVADTTQPSISRVERGDGAVTLKMLRRAADALGVPVYMLFLDETSAAELNILKFYRSLSDDGKVGFQKAAELAISSTPTIDQ